jgi:hypothetical protein
MNSPQQTTTCTTCNLSQVEVTAENARHNHKLTCCDALAFAWEVEKKIWARNYRKAMSGPKRPLRYAFSDGSKYEPRPFAR